LAFTRVFLTHRASSFSLSLFAYVYDKPQALYGPQLYRSRTLEMNASDERGIQVCAKSLKHV
jgi:hypothetical protein